MKRRLFNLVAFVSLVLCTVMIVLGARSYRIEDTIQWENTADGIRYYRLVSVRGDAHVHCQWVTFAGPTAPTKIPPLLGDQAGWHTRRDPKPIQRADFWSRRGFFFGYSRNERQMRWLKAMTERPDATVAPYRQIDKSFLIGIPHWFAGLLLAIVPAWWVVKWRQRRLPECGLCLCCGYDMRASPERCPECGAPAAREGHLAN